MAPSMTEPPRFFEKVLNPVDLNPVDLFGLKEPSDFLGLDIRATEVLGAF